MSEQVYSRTNGKPVLVDSVVLFLDLLGSSDVAQSTDAQKYLVNLDKALTDARKLTANEPKYGPSRHQASWFSDNLAMAKPLVADGEIDLGSTIMLVSALQLTLGEYDLFARGAIAVGEHYMDDGVNFGPALVEAVGLEKATKFPRVALGPKAVAGCRYFHDRYDDGKSPWSDYLLVENQSEVFVDYLVSAAALLGNVDQTFEMLDDHRDRVERKLQKHQADSKVLAKYEWLASYHNHVCNEMGLTELRIDDTAALDLQNFGAS